MTSDQVPTAPRGSSAAATGGRGPARRDHQAVPGCRRELQHQHRGPPRHRARPGRRERRRQVDADEDPLRHAPARRGHDRGQRHEQVVPLPGRRDRGRHRHGAPALHAGRQPDRAGRTSCSAPSRWPVAGWTSAGPASGSASIAKRYGLDVDVDAPVEDLGVGSRQRVEILKVLYRGAKILILDEPTAVLVPQEVDELFGNLRELKSEGLTIIFISHKLDEVRADRRRHHGDPARHDGRHRRPEDGDQPAARRDDGRLGAAGAGAAGIDGDRPGGAAAVRRPGVRRRRPGRAVRHRPRPFTPARHSASPVSRATGSRNWSTPSWASGRSPRARSSWAAATSAGLSTRDRREAGIGFIPEDRHRQGLILEGTLWENRMLGHQTRKPSAGGLLIDRSAAKARHPADRRGVRRPHPGHRRQGRRRCPAATSRSSSSAAR